MSAESRAGFTLLEAAVAIALVGLVSVAILATVSTELRGAERQARVLEATALAQDRLARIEVLNGAELHVLPDSMREGGFAAPFSEYRWSAAARPVTDEEDLHDIVVTVTWEDGSFGLSTRLYRPIRVVRTTR